MPTIGQRKVYTTSFYLFSQAPLYEPCHTWSLQLTLSLNSNLNYYALITKLYRKEKNRKEKKRKEKKKKKKKKRKKFLYYFSMHTTSTNVVCLLGIHVSTSFITMANKYWATLVSVKENHFHDPLQLQIVCQSWANVSKYCM